LLNFKSNQDRALLHFEFDDKSADMSQSLVFLHSMATFFIEKLAKNPSAEITHSVEALTEEETE